MTPWAEVERSAPELAAQVLARFLCHPHHILGTLRSDGSPRLSGINVMCNDGYLWFGSMPGAVKLADIERDARIALHSAPLHESLEGGDAQISGIAVPLEASRVKQWRPDTPNDGEYFSVLINSMHLVVVEGENLAVNMWDNEHGVRSVNRR